MKIWFITRNKNKFQEANRILSSYNIEIEMININRFELQSDDLIEIAHHSALEAYKRLKRPLIVEDAGLFIRALKGFPGPYSSYVFKTIGIKGILKLLSGVDDRYAEFVSVVAFASQRGEIFVFKGITEGKISYSARGGGWGFDPIFIPRGYDKTYGELGDLKNEISHRRKSLEKFAKWFKSSKFN